MTLHITHVIKRDGQIQEFKKEKLDHWAQWASNELRIDWEDVSKSAFLRCENYCKTSDLQNAMIDACIDKESTAHQKMAGRLLIGDIYHRLFNGVIPSVKEQHNRTVALGMVKKLEYSDGEWQEIEKMIDHSRDMKLKHSQVVQLCNKFGLKSAVTGELYETPQFLFMRQALFYGSQLPKERRLKDIKEIYNRLSQEKLCAPTPNHLYVGTTRGTAPSCVVVRSEDDLPSMSALNQAVWSCSATGSGLGASMSIRSPKDPVRNTTIEHNGKLEYYRTVMTLARANQQAGRSGAVTMHYTCLDPEVMDIARMRNPTTVDQKRLGEMDFSFGSNAAFADAVRENKDWMLVSVLYAPRLWELLYQPDKGKFLEEYNKVLADEKIPKKLVNARKILLTVLREAIETRQYEHFTDEMNRHTPFLDTIYSSNLCVTPETLILTSKGNLPIKTLEGSEVEVWNGKEFSKVIVRKTGENQKVIKVTLDNGMSLECTPYHKFYKVNGYRAKDVEKVEAHTLQVGDKLIKVKYPVITAGEIVLENAYANGFYSADGTEVGNSQRLYFYGEKKKLVSRCGNIFKSVTSSDSSDRLQGDTNVLNKKYFVPKNGYDVYSRVEWLSGVLDGDGHVQTNGDTNNIVLSNTNIVFLKDIQEMLTTLGVSSRISLYSEEGYKSLPANDGSGIYKSFLCNKAYRIIIGAKGIEQLVNLGMSLSRIVLNGHNGNREATKFPKVVSVVDEGRYSDTYCFNEPKRNMGVFNGILTGQCQEIALPTAGYKQGQKGLDNVNPDEGGEIATCNLCGINVANIDGDEDYELTAYYALLMIMVNILTSHYPFKQMEETSISRMSAGVSILNLAHLMAKNGMKYSDIWGKKFIHRLAETHSYFLHKAALKLGKEFGNAKWVGKTKYPSGWLPVDTRNEKAKAIAHQPLKRDWETLRKEIVENGGIAFSVLETAVPSESSSIAQDSCNGLYPIREGIITKKDGKKVVQWIAPQWEELQDQYEKAFTISTKDMTDLYAIVQCFTGQGISADYYMAHKRDENGKIVVSGKQLIKDWLYRQEMGMKSRYYINHSTNGVYQQAEAASCSSGGCTL